MTVCLAAGLLCCEKEGASPGPQSGTGGSMARFAITGNVLYVATQESLDVYDISTPDQPVKSGTKQLGFGIETIFPYQNNLFIGANDGLYIFDNTIPGKPELLSGYSHVQSCDPVVVQGQYAYLTLRGGAACRWGITSSSLDVVDISELENPRLIHSQGMHTPYGLAASGNKLFVCEGISGFKVFDLTDPRQPVLQKNHALVYAYDVIVRNTSDLMITGQDGLMQYRYREDGTMDLLSKIPITYGE